jgi:aspartyl-tRNA synthetase
MKIEGEDVKSPIAKFLDDAAIAGIRKRCQAVDGDILFFGAGLLTTVSEFMGALRVRVAHDRGLVEEGWQPLWITEWPLFEWDDKTERWYAMNHPFTSPTGDIASIESNPCGALARAYDVVLNGSEIGGGSIRIHDPQTQLAVLKLLGMDETEARNRFGFLIEALRYGAPPHGGIAFGLDRMAALMAGRDSIRDVIAFPKTTAASCLMTEAPSAVDQDQLDELHVSVKRAD